jgi:hypothetical protein
MKPQPLKVCVAENASLNPPPGVSRHNIRRKIKPWVENQPCCSVVPVVHRDRLGPDMATRARLLSFSRTQSRVVIGLLTGRNTLRRHLYTMGLSNNPTCRKWGTEEEASGHICVSVRPWSHSDIYSWVPSFWTLRISGN